tara:strand:- start:473 stop:694 length:222 start_codon:yes stop_codon:yes gene_type:complete
MSVKHITFGGFKRICSDTTSYGYVSDEVYQTWEECPVCFTEYRKMQTTTHPPASEPVVEETKKGLYLRGALDG